MFRTNKKLVMTLIGLLLVVSLFSDGEEKYAEGTIFFRVFSDFAYIEVNGEGIIETDQEWFNLLSNQFSIYEMMHLFSYSTEPDLQHYYSCMFPDTLDLDVVKNSFKAKTGYVEDAYKDIAIELYEVPNDEYYQEYQWPLHIVHSEAAWDVDVPPAEQIIVAVVDTGVNICDYTQTQFDIHLDLTENILKNANGEPVSYNVFWEFDPAYDDIGHGTHVAGIVAATSNNGIGVASLAGWHDNIEIMPVKIFRRQPSGGGIAAFGSRASDAIVWAAGYNPYWIGADIINMSWGPSSALDLTNEDELEYYELIMMAVGIANTAGSICVASASNFGSDFSDKVLAPASLPGVISVAASNMYDEKANYSTYADWVTITAPGGDGIYSINNAHSVEGFLSTIPLHTNYSMYLEGRFQFGSWEPNGIPEPYYDFLQGTSMSGPMVCSLLALMKAKYPNYSNDEIRGKILGTADDIYLENWDYIGKLGAGRINAYKALTESEQPTLRFHSITLDDEDDGIFECEETAEINIELKNWWIDAQNVTGILSTEDGNIEISNNPLIFGDINQETISSQNNIIIITETSSITNPRTITFDLELTADNMQDVTLHFNVEIHPNSNNPFISLPLQAGETFTTHLVEADTDNDNYSEILVGTSFGNLFLCKYDGTYISFATTNATPIHCTPAIADINNNGFKEIIAGDDEGNIYVWDHNGNLLSCYVFLDGKCVESIVVEDVTGDGQLEIIVLTFDQQEQNMYLNVINPTNGDFSTLFLETGIIVPFITPLSVANVDDDIEKEIALVLKPNNVNCILKVFSVTPELVISEGYSINIGDNNTYPISGPIIADLNEDGIQEIVSSYKNPNAQTSMLIAYNYGLTNPYFEDINVCSSMLYKEQICIANIRTDFTGLEILCGDSDLQFLYDCYGNEISEFSLSTGFGLKLRSIININADNEQELLYLKDIALSSFLVYDNDGNAITEWNIMGNFYDLTTVSFSEQTNMTIILLNNNGYLYKFPFSFSEQSTSEWSQYQNNSRNTGCYYQPLPEEFNDNITLKHDAVIDKNIKIGNTLTIEEGTEIRFEKNKSLNFTGSTTLIPGGLICIGTEEDSIRFGGLCSNETRNYWYGITFNNKRTSKIEHSIIQNAYTGLSYYDGESHKLDKNRISNNDVGLGFYNSSFCVNVNEIIDNNYGVSCDKYASPFFGYPGVTNPDIGHNGIFYNDIGVFINKATPSFEDGFNDICSNDILNMKYNVDITGPEIRIAAQNNWWGSNIEIQIIMYLDPAENIIYDPWCDSPQTIFSNRGDSLTIFQQACVKLYEEQYYEATGLFQQVIEDSIETIEDQISVASLYTCYSILESIIELGYYIDERLGSQPSEVMEKCLKNYKALVNRALENYNDAIVYYEDILLNNPSYVDSCYAVIDIGNTYLEANGRATGRLMYLQPESFESHLYITQLLLESIRTGNHIKNDIPQVKKCVLHKNYPNPFNPETTISFSILEDSKVELSIYNIRGQKVRTLIKNEFEKGFHKLIWYSRDNNKKPVATGVYFYKLKVNGKDKAVKKMLLLK